MRMRYVVLSLLYLSVYTAGSFYSAAQSSLPFKNLGPKINTTNDEYLPVVYNDTLYFRRVISSSAKNFVFDIFKIACIDLNFKNDTTAPQPIVIYNTLDYTNSREPVSPWATTGNVAINDPSTPGFFDFSSDKLNYYKLDRPERIQGEINTPFNDMHPAISPDGSFIVFASDRPKKRGETERAPDLDLYITYRNEDNTWSKPKNLGKEINTSENDFTPFIAKDGSLYFASKGYIRDSVNIVFSGQRRGSETLSDIYLIAERPNYNIIAAEPTGKEKEPFENPVMLPPPINTEFNETGPAIWNDSIFFLASDRLAPYDRPSPYNQSGYDIYGHIYSPFPEQPPQPPDIPFFVTGYYRPNTTINLNELRDKFYRGLFGAGSADFVANPDRDYDEDGNLIDYDFFARQVDLYVGEVIENLTEWAEYARENGGRVDILVKGYSDPRPVAGAAKYVEKTISDPRTGFYIRSGADIDNEGLSTIRAYFTSRELRRAMPEKFRDSDHVGWVIEGGGIYEGANENVQRRKVEIYVQYYSNSG